VVPTEGVHLILSPSASPYGFGTSPFECSALKGGGKDGGKGQVPFLILGSPFCYEVAKGGAGGAFMALPEGVRFQCTIDNVQLW